MDPSCPTHLSNVVSHCNPDWTGTYDVTRVTLSLWQSSCICLLSAKIIGVQPNATPLEFSPLKLISQKRNRVICKPHRNRMNKISHNLHFREYIVFSLHSRYIELYSCEFLMIPVYYHLQIV